MNATTNQAPDYVRDLLRLVFRFQGSMDVGREESLGME
jgi:hypothetical protein